MFKKTGYIMTGLVLVAIMLIGIGCDNNGDVIYLDDDYVTFVNDYGESIIVEPFGTLLYPGGSVDIDIGNDIVFVTVIREFDGLILLETDVEGGDVWVIQ